MFGDVSTDPGVDNLFYDFRHEAKIRYWTVEARGSFGSRDCFFRSGRTIARLQRTGSLDCSSEALHIPEMIGANISQARFTNQVGTGSSWHCFAADFCRMAVTSAADVRRKWDSGSATSLSVITGDGDAAVDARIRSILSVN